jgi:S1-C subfamily serine protease
VEVIVACNGKPVKTFSDLKRISSAGRGKPLTLEVYRGQKPVKVVVK